MLPPLRAIDGNLQFCGMNFAPGLLRARNIFGVISFEYTVEQGARVWPDLSYTLVRNSE